MTPDELYVVHFGKPPDKPITTPRGLVEPDLLCDSFELLKHRWLDQCREIATKTIPLPIDPQVFHYMPWGHQMFVMPVPPEERYGTFIHIPETNRRANNSGWVVIPGTEVTLPDPQRLPVVCPYDHPLDMVGLFVSWRMNAGYELRSHGLDPRFAEQSTPLLYMNVGDILYECAHPEEVMPTRKGTETQ